MEPSNDETTKNQTSIDNKSDLIRSAISFLNDDTVKDAPLTKKIEFLQSKGLNKEEIQFALDESQKFQNTNTISNNKNDTHFNNNNDNSNNNDNDNINNTSNYMYDILPPPLPERTWKDYFVMATVTAGLFYGLYEVTRRYVIPNILPVSKKRLEKDKGEIKDQFEKIDQVLNEIEREHKEFKEREQTKLNELDTTIEQLEISLEENKKTREKIDDDFRLLKLELSNLQNTLEKVMKNDQNVKEIDSINQEIVSLKNLIKNCNIFSQQQTQIDQSANSIQDIHGNNKGNGSGNEPVDILSIPVADSIPGIEVIPSASELLAKFNKKNAIEPATTNQTTNNSNSDHIDNNNNNNNNNDLEETTKSA